MTQHTNPVTIETTKPKSKRPFWVLIGLLAVSGVVMAFIVMFGMFDSVAYSLVWRVFVADLYLIASLTAQHTWLRRAAWVATGLTFLLGAVNVFWRYTPYWQWADGRSSMTSGDPSTGWSPWFGFEQDLEFAGHTVTIGLIVLSFISLAYRWVSNQRGLQGIYVFTFAAGLISIVLGVLLTLSHPYRMPIDSWVSQLMGGMVILTLTGAAIVTIGAFVQRRASRVDERNSAVGSQESHPASGQAPQSLAALSPDELRTLVRGYVDEYLTEGGR